MNDIAEIKSKNILKLPSIGGIISWLKKSNTASDVIPLNHDDDLNQSRSESIYNKGPQERLFFYFEYRAQDYVRNFSKMSKKIQKLHDDGANVDFKDKNENTSLHSICRLRKYSVECYVKLRELKASLTKNSFGQNILHKAALENNIDLVNQLLKRDFKEDIEKLINEKTYGENQTPLHYAAREGHLEIVESFLNEKAQLESKDQQERTPLYLAAEHGQKETVRHLISKDANIDVINKHGQKALYWIINSCDDLGSEVLDRYMEHNYYTKRDIFHLMYVESELMPDDSIPKAQSILANIVENKKMDLIVHPVISQLVKVKWRKYGRLNCFTDFFLTILFVANWNILGAVVAYDKRHSYKFPEDWWRLFLLLIGVLGVFILFAIELREIYHDYKYQQDCNTQRQDEIADDQVYRQHNNNEVYLAKEEEKVQDFRFFKLIKVYITNLWNIFDIISILLIIISVITHIVDVVNHTEAHAKIHNRTLAITIVVISARLLKVSRVIHEQLGILVITLTSSLRDIVLWFIIFAMAWIPFTSAFWMLYAGIERFESYGNVLYVLYLITYGADLYEDRDRMNDADDVMTDILMGTYMGVTGLILVNLFIALLTATFNSIHDASKAQLLLQRGMECLGIERKMSDRKLKKHLNFLKDPSIGKINYLTKFVSKNSHSKKITKIEKVIQDVDSKTSNLEKNFKELKDHNAFNSDFSSDYDKCCNEIQELKGLVELLIQKKIDNNYEQPIFVGKSTPQVDILYLNEIDTSDELQIDPITNDDNQQSDI